MLLAHPLESMALLLFKGNSISEESFFSETVYGRYSKSFQVKDFFQAKSAFSFLLKFVFLSLVFICFLLPSFEKGSTAFQLQGNFFISSFEKGSTAFQLQGNFFISSSEKGSTAFQLQGKFYIPSVSQFAPPSTTNYFLAQMAASPELWLKRKMAFEIRKESLFRPSPYLQLKEFLNFSPLEKLCLLTNSLNTSSVCQADATSQAGDERGKLSVHGLLAGFEKLCSGIECFYSIFNVALNSFSICNDIYYEFFPKSYRIVSTQSSYDTSSCNEKLIWPVYGFITSGYGFRRHPITKRRSFHDGIDIRASWGTPIQSPCDGVVVSAARCGAIGRLIKIYDRKRGVMLYFGHLSAFKCFCGQFIRKGQLIGLVGSSGRATGPHLHFSIKLSGRKVNPLLFLSSR
ncbi:MAG: M23 family metallopeptidase [Candidatus Riflebacteria bacterium]|nr:M23 family metallopeptidase [Candidatus Riflebacteria bacterium]